MLSGSQVTFPDRWTMLANPEQRTQRDAILDQPLVMMEICQEMMANMCRGPGRGN
jgi:hypothetical protein